MSSKKKNPKKTLEILQELGIPLDELTIKIVKMLERQKVLAEDKIAASLKLKINEARKLLYALNTRGVAVYTKKKDPKRKWWYLYFWSLDRERIKAFYLAHKLKELAAKEEQLKAEQRYVFFCASCGARFTYEEALDASFTCPNCGETLEELKDSKIIRKVKREIRELERELEKLQKRKT